MSDIYSVSIGINSTTSCLQPAKQAHAYHSRVLLQLQKEIREKYSRQLWHTLQGRAILSGKLFDQFITDLEALWVNRSLSFHYSAMHYAD